MRVFLNSLIPGLLWICTQQVCAQDLPEKWYEVVGGRWKVEPSLLRDIVVKLQLAATKESRRRGIEEPDLGSYVLQYQGVAAMHQGVVDDDARSVFIRGACEISEDSLPLLTKVWSITPDGSGCYFGALYDATSNEIKAFSFR